MRLSLEIGSILVTDMDGMETLDILDSSRKI